MNLALITEIFCRQRKISFLSKNALLKHLKLCFNSKKAIHISRKNNNVVTTYAETILANAFTFIFRFNIDANKNIDIDYDFKK